MGKGKTLHMYLLVKINKKERKRGQVKWFSGNLLPSLRLTPSILGGRRTQAPAVPDLGGMPWHMDIPLLLHMQ